MKTLFNKLFLAVLYFSMHFILVQTCFAQNTDKQIKYIGIVMPIEHQALYEISKGFQDALKTLYKNQIKFKISSAQGDLNLQHSIITQMRDTNYDLIVPIATSVTQMTASMVKSIPIIGLATDLKDTKENLVIVNDEIDKEKIITFIHRTYPNLKHITLIYSASDKIFPEVEQVKTGTKNYQINLHQLMIQNLADLYNASNAIPTKTEAIFILKDNLVVSGIDTLVQIAKNRKIPLISCDDGTVQKGATFALGVPEKQIGVEGAKLAAKILQGTTPNKLTSIKLTTPIVFVNSQALTSIGQNINSLKNNAKEANYVLEIIK